LAKRHSTTPAPFHVSLVDFVGNLSSKSNLSDITNPVFLETKGSGASQVRHQAKRRRRHKAHCSAVEQKKQKKRAGEITPGPFRSRIPKGLHEFDGIAALFNIEQIVDLGVAAANAFKDDLSTTALKLLPWY
jgi:hypothetical protein